MIKELVRQNRSYRGYDESFRISRETLEDLVECARLCPSSVNKQPLKYYLAWESEQVAVVQSMTRWARALPQMKLPHPGKNPTAFIIICQDTSVDENLNRYQKDVGIVAQTMLLAAVEQGLGGCMIGNFTAGEVQEKLQLGENLKPLLIVALGKPAEEIILVDVPEDGNTNYYRDDRDRHYVPKRSLEEELIN
ncbi:MAG: nitroreductase family protein [Fusicatenibacter sp.]|nr:nitroreductase family protein [Lachnospiraceae bacterium]MDY2938019.1 nitroreductase family protein [Fusicatenibacter sp.]